MATNKTFRPTITLSSIKTTSIPVFNNESTLIVQIIPLLHDTIAGIWELSHWFYWRRRRRQGRDLPKLNPDDDRFLDESNDRVDIQINELFLKTFDHGSEIYEKLQLIKSEENMKIIISNWINSSSYLYETYKKDLFNVSLSCHIKEQKKLLNLENVQSNSDDVKNILNGLELEKDQTKGDSILENLI